VIVLGVYTQHNFWELLCLALFKGRRRDFLAEKKTIKSRRRRDFFKGKVPQKLVFFGKKKRPDQGTKRQRNQRKCVSEEGTFGGR
jgi:hypothetical protein